MNKETANETELSAIKTNPVANNGNGETKKKEPVTFSTRIHRFLNFFTVEPFLLCYILPNIISNIAVYKLNIEKACRAELNFTEEVCTQVVASDFRDNITKEALEGAQILNAHMTSWQTPLQSSIPAIMILFVGAWSDRTGNRKALMLTPILGELISSIGLILTTYYFLEWPLWITGLIEGLPQALTGGFSIALMGSYSFIADVTTIESRTFRVGVVAVIVTLAIPFGTLISGVLTEAVGYYGIFGIKIALNVIGFVHTYFRIHDVRRAETGGTFKEKLALFFHPRHVWDTISLVVMTRGRRLMQILLVIWAHIVIIGPVLAEGQLVYPYAQKKFSMDLLDLSKFLTYSTLMGLAGTAVAVTVFSKLFKMHDAQLGIIATACKVASSFLYAFAPTREWFYAGPAVDFFGNSGVTAIRALGTKIVEPDQVGKICSLIGLVEAVVPVMYTPLYSEMYAHTLDTFPGAFYLLGGIMTIPAFFIFIGLYVLYKRQQRDEVKNPAVKEMYAHENAVTAL